MEQRPHQLWYNLRHGTAFWTYREYEGEVPTTEWEGDALQHECKDESTCTYAVPEWILKALAKAN
jgi:hypothetical protein